jgi:carboxylate-amine ligase
MRGAGVDIRIGASTHQKLVVLAADHDAGRPLPRHERGLIEENLWRAQRHGVTGRLIDLERGEERTTREAIEGLLRWSEATHEPLGLTPFLEPVGAMLRRGNGAERQRASFARTGDARAVHAEVVERTRESAGEVLRRLAVGAA